MRVTVQQVRDPPARCTSPACASRFSAAVTACGLGPQPVPVMNPMWRPIRFGFITAALPLNVGLRNAASTWSSMLRSSRRMTFRAGYRS
jgi:hypothetical protein